MDKIEKELHDIVKFKTKRGEKRPEELNRLRKEVDGLSDEQYKELSDGAQKWANAANKAHDDEKPIPDFGEPEAAEKPAKAKAEPKAEKAKAEPKAEKAKAEPKPPAPKKPAGGGKIDQMKVLMLKNLKLTPDELATKLQAAEIEVSKSTIATVRSDFISSIRVLQKAGHLVKDLIED